MAPTFKALLFAVAAAASLPAFAQSIFDPRTPIAPPPPTLGRPATGTADQGTIITNRPRGVGAGTGAAGFDRRNERTGESRPPGGFPQDGIQFPLPPDPKDRHQFGLGAAAIRVVKN